VTIICDNRKVKQVVVLMCDNVQFVQAVQGSGITSLSTETTWHIAITSSSKAVWQIINLLSS
jgi:hypothetical protein